ncbi:pyridoxamine 5'-phosphate oxidase family protein [Spongiactinospora sp. TRM90649]|uniref:pyridoxamine 5'-phosphate oxidase family protein n=1 Tax=Spongiactinospora sp. TRM90649 TaxID=3031114 RepID=UPI0023F86F51|nr:pyridoxamine 5'-phosphate oxidase family protein [Spongiactinospora sp. TRM90649]MDF5754280.1 pyridoxamine 5'-phosphate oxidase family protein [Spongiactinospora sp. TRM90649]
MPTRRTPPAPGDLGRRIAHHRNESGLSRDEVAARTGVDAGYVEYLEETTARPTDGMLLKIARALGTTPEELLGGELEHPPGGGGPAREPVLTALTEQECLRLIAPGGVGRIAFDGRTGITVIPVNYRTGDGGAVVFRTRYGGVIDEDLRTGLEGVEFKIAFEVDRIDEAHSAGWSVLIQGPIHHITEAELAGVTGLGVEPWAGGERDLYVRIAPHRVTGRRIANF